MPAEIVRVAVRSLLSLLAPLIVAISLSAAPLPASAQASWMIFISGRIMAAAAACHVDTDRLVALDRRVGARIGLDSGLGMNNWIAGAAEGLKEIQSGRTSCAKAIEALEILEREMK